MSQSTSLADKSKPARAPKRPRRTGNLGGSSHASQDNAWMVAMGIRITPQQRDELERLSKGLMMHKADLVRKSLDLGIEWAIARMAVLGKKK
jgi:hypothetical protein